ncbi:hypothetical protein [Methylobacterium iners]|uniref:Uncharacterized protein n=1 Tax=Methylobacterium iners TaxID=418707 RepID=A0ABQ4S3U8_9HYPH|nr:hypothetical protein [Methylobacterium iners]GJD97576.1 hypothetical protein OCOJLMKI_4808 [Methylobacterium iners]
MHRQVTLAAAALLSASCAQAQSVKIVGIGASTCTRFNAEIAAAPSAERDYLAWAQGFMSGALVRAPPGVDEGLDLAPADFPLGLQAEFLRDFCLKHEAGDFSDAVHALYRRLRGGGT